MRNRVIFSNLDADHVAGAVNELYEYPAEYFVLWTGMKAERGQRGCNPPHCLSQMPRLVGGVIYLREHISRLY